MPPLPRVVNYPHIPRFAPEPPVPLSADGAIPIDVDQVFLINKAGSAAALTIAAPGAANIGRRIKVLTGSDFAHVVTFTGSTLRDGTTGAKITWTAPAFEGAGAEFVATTATRWLLQNKNLGTVA